MKNRFSSLALTCAIAASLLAPASAFATSEDDWTLSSSLNSTSYDSDNKLVMNVSRCRELFDISTGEISFVLSLSSSASISSDAVYSLKFAKGNESCSKSELDEISTDSCITIADNQTLTSSTSPIEVQRKVDSLSAATDAASCENLNTSSYLYLIVNDPVSGSDNIYTVTYTLDFRTERPAAPSGVSATAGGESIKVSWDAVSDATSYKVYYGKEGVTMDSGLYPEDLSDTHSATSSSTSITIKSNVSADTTYLLSVTAIDSKGNESTLGEVVTVETVASKDFWDSYREENADVDGGFCFIATAAYGSTQEPHVKILREFRDKLLLQSEAGKKFVDTYYRFSPPMAYFIGQHPTLRAITRTALWPLYGFAWMLLYMPALLWTILACFACGIGFCLYRKIRKKHASNALVPLLAAAVATGAMTATPSEALAESPVDMMAEFKAGPYTPDSLGSAFSQHFGDNSGFIIEGEYDWQFWRGVGSLGVGFHLAYGNISGKALEESGEESIDSTELHWLPLRISLVYRFDYLWTRFNFPFTLYAKAGFDYAFYWIVDGSDSVATADDDSKGYGGTFGFHVVAGLAFVLDWLAPDMEKSFDVEWGINNSYLFAEFMYSNINNFGAKGAFDLSDKATFHIGLGLEF